MGSHLFCKVSLTSLNGDKAFSWSQLCTPDSSPWAGEALDEESHGGNAEVDGPDAATRPKGGDGCGFPRKLLIFRQ